MRICHQLYQAVRRQAVTNLVETTLLIALDRELGVVVSQSELEKALRRAQAEHGSEAAFNAYLASMGMTMADELAQLKFELLGAKTLKLYRSSPAGRQRVVEAVARWTARTSCSAGNVVEHCRNYSQPVSAAATGSAAADAVELVGALATGNCYASSLCGKL